MKLFVASLFTVLLLSSFLGAIVFAFMYITGTISITLFILLVVFLNFVLWLVTPKISDIIYRWFFKMRWMTMNELRTKSPSAAQLIESVCRKYNFNIPKLGIIKDKNPNAFTYGSGRWNSRIIVTEGIFKYLEDDNIKAVYGHELGHIKNRDFIIMTVASTIMQLLYVIYVHTRYSSSRGNGKSRSNGALLTISIISFIFYWISQYVVLYLSRIREYYADQFSAEETQDPNALSIALIRIAYGILANPDDVKLVKTTKTIGLVNFAASKSVGMYYHMSYKHKNPALLESAFLYDLKNPWAKIYEISSTHPLTGKRIRRLSALCKKFSVTPVFDFEKIERTHTVDKGRLYRNFFKDIAAISMPFVFAAGIIAYYSFLFLSGTILFSFYSLFGFLSLFLIFFGLGNVLKTIYRYPGKPPKKSNVLELMSDIYASPVRGKRVVIEGKFIGRGIPGFIFSEDLMMEDSTGLIYLNYESWLPIIGNLIFSITKVKNLVGKSASADGWFLRGMNSRLDINKLVTKQGRIRSYIKLLGMFGGVLFIIAGMVMWSFLHGIIF